MKIINRKLTKNKILNKIIQVKKKKKLRRIKIKKVMILNKIFKIKN